jgi:hypothetical protein
MAGQHNLRMAGEPARSLNFNQTISKARQLWFATGGLLQRSGVTIFLEN